MRRLCHAQPLNNRKRTRNALSRVVRSGGVVPYPHSKTVILPYANGYPGFYLMFFFSLQYSSTIASRIPAARPEGSPFAAQGILIF